MINNAMAKAGNISVPESSQSILPLISLLNNRYCTSILIRQPMDKPYKIADGPLNTARHMPIDKSTIAEKNSMNQRYFFSWPTALK